MLAVMVRRIFSRLVRTIYVAQPTDEKSAFQE